MTSKNTPPIALNTLTSILQQAGEEIILPAYHTSIQSTQKTDGSFVTDTDITCQRFIASALTQLDHSIAFLGEEMDEDEQLTCLKHNQDRYWCLDPLDGTSNFIASFPCFAISLALVECGVPQLACIYDPIRQEMFSAKRHTGAWLNGKSMQCSAL